jgi:hypothetical protein
MNHHQLYVLTGDSASRSSTLELLKFIHANLAVLKSMGVVVKVVKITKAELSNKRIVKSMQDKGISRLPAMVVPSGKIIIGVERILTVYKNNITDYKNMSKQKRSPSTSLGDFYKSEIAKQDGDEDEEFGESGGMISSYHQMVSSREQKKPPSSKSNAGLQRVESDKRDPKKDGAAPNRTGGGPPAPTARPSNPQSEQRPDNVNMGLTNCDEDDTADDLMERAFLMNTGELDD